MDCPHCGQEIFVECVPDDDDDDDDDDQEGQGPLNLIFRVRDD